jgi:hypothetical protein
MATLSLEFTSVSGEELDAGCFCGTLGTVSPSSGKASFVNDWTVSAGTEVDGVGVAGNGIPNAS